jgi:hypothetical protein
MAAGKALKVGVSGSYKSVVGYAKSASGFITSSGVGTANTGYNTVDVKTDSEVHFKASGTTDSGMKVGVGIELESDQASSATPIDGSYLTLGGGFGNIMLGSSGAAAAVLSVNAPSAGAIGIFGGDSHSWVPRPGAVSVATTAGANIGGGDRAKIRWTSPSFSGFTAGGSYQPDGTADNAMPSNGGNAGTDASQVDVALKYAGKMGANAVSASVGWWAVDAPTTAANASTSTEAYSLGASTTMGAFTVGVGYKEVTTTGHQLGTGAASISGTANSDDEEVLNIGVAWTQGKTTLALNYFQSEMELATATEGEDSLTKWTIGAKQNIGPGIDFLGTVQNVVWSDEGGAAGDNNKGTAFVGGIAVAF